MIRAVKVYFLKSLTEGGKPFLDFCQVFQLYLNFQFRVIRLKSKVPHLEISGSDSEVGDGLF